jgi:hypothetical protein
VSHHAARGRTLRSPRTVRVTALAPPRPGQRGGERSTARTTASDASPLMDTLERRRAPHLRRTRPPSRARRPAGLERGSAPDGRRPAGAARETQLTDCARQPALSTLVLSSQSSAHFETRGAAPQGATTRRRRGQTDGAGSTAAVSPATLVPVCTLKWWNTFRPRLVNLVPTAPWLRGGDTQRSRRRRSPTSRDVHARHALHSGWLNTCLSNGPGRSKPAGASDIQTGQTCRPRSVVGSAVRRC